MHEKMIRDFAIKHGFQDVKEIGTYQNARVYVPIFLDGKIRVVGYPQYILVDNEDIQLKTDISFEITKKIFPDSN